MGIKVKVATTSKELNDVYRLRYQVYKKSLGHCVNAQNDLLLDQFDTIPESASIIAYNDDSPIGTIRVNADSAIKLPSDQLFDFSEYRAQILQLTQQLNQSLKIVSASMLAIEESHRNRRDVFQALFKMCCDIAFSWQATHIISTVSSKTISIYKRLKFKELSPPVWIPSLGDFIIPIVSEFTPIYEWAFGAFIDKSQLLKSFSGNFQCLLISAGHPIFHQGSVGSEAYLISRGLVNISQSDHHTNKTLSLATLSRGSMFGELSLIDEGIRNANATALSNTELIVLDKNTFWLKANHDVRYLRGLLAILAKRLRDVDQRAFIYAHGDTATRLNFFINKVLEQAQPSSKHQNQWVARLTLEDFCYMASTSYQQTYAYLTELEKNHRIRLHTNKIIFFGDEEITR